MTTPAMPELPEPEAYIFQHEETGNTMFVDRQQVEWGFEKNNPRLQKVGKAFTADQMRARDAMWAERLAALSSQPSPELGEAHVCIFHAVPLAPGDVLGPQEAACITCGKPPRVLSGEQPAAAGVSDALRDLVAAIDNELSEEWTCNSYHPSLRPALKAARAILALRPAQQSESEARRAAQEQLYTERERHTAEVKRLQAEIGRLQSAQQAVPMTDDVFGVLKKVHETAVYVGDGECSITMNLVREIDAIFERSTAHHGTTAQGAQGEQA